MVFAAVFGGSLFTTEGQSVKVTINSHSSWSNLRTLLLDSKNKMDSPVLYIAPCVAVAFFVLLGIFVFCFYHYTSDNSEEEREENFHKQKHYSEGHVQVDIGETRGGIKSYFVVIHLWYILLYKESFKNLLFLKVLRFFTDLCWVFLGPADREWNKSSRITKWTPSQLPHESMNIS